MFYRTYRASLTQLLSLKSSMVFPATYGTWTAFYERERNDSGAIQRLFRTKLSRFTTMTENHLDNPVRLLGTIAGSNYGNMLLIPGVTGFMQVLHHGFTHAGELGDEPDIVATYGNLSEAALKVIPVNATVALLGNNAGRRSAVDCPTLEDFLGATTADEFVALEPAGNGILKQKPNHILIGPETFRLTRGEKLTPAKDLAIALLDKFKADDEDDDQVNEARLEEALEAEFLLAILWASTRGILVPIDLTDPPESAVLNSIHQEIKHKLLTTDTLASDENDNEGRGMGDDRGHHDDIPHDFSRDPHLLDGDETSHAASSGSPDRANDRLRELSITTSGIVEIMRQAEEARQRERATDSKEKSLLKHMGNQQRELFLTLSTPDLRQPPVLSTFMNEIAGAKTAHRALVLAQAEARLWEGTFSPGGFHRFLSTGFMSQETNTANPGGFTLYMFHPRTVDLSGGKTFDAGRARIRDLFDAQVDDETILHYSKQGLFSASNHHDLRVQLQTAFEMLELILGPGTIAAQGLAYVLDQSRWRRLTVVLHERFLNEQHFGTKFLYCLERNLQQFFNHMSDWGSRTQVDLWPNFLRDEAAKLLNLVDGGFEVTVRLPSALQPVASLAAPSIPLAIEASPAGAPAKKKGRKAGTPGPAGEPGSMIVQNPAAHAAWKLPEGKRYSEFFQGRDQSTKNWPMIEDERLGARSPAPLCIRFQATAACRRSCRLAHVTRASLDVATKRKVDDRFSRRLRSSRHLHSSRRHLKRRVAR